jgi:hypothetical protein
VTSVSPADDQWAKVPDLRPNDLDIVAIDRSILAITLSFHRVERDFLCLDLALMPEALNHPRVEMNLERVEMEIHGLDTGFLLRALSMLSRDKTSI